MPDIFDILFSQQARELLPPDKRDGQTKNLLSSLLYPVQWCRDLFLGSYKTGATAPAWSPGAYNVYDQVLYAKSVWYNLLQGNTDTPGATITWLKIQNNFIGVDDRVKFNGVSIVLEYALNFQFGGTFRQPGTGISDIYFNLLPATITGWRIGEDTGTAMGENTSDESVGGPTPFIRLNNFNINIPTALFALTNNEAIRNFTNIYIPSSINYTITQY